MADIFDLQVQGFDKLMKALDTEVLKKNIGKATLENAQLGAKEVKNSIARRELKSNAPLTILLKRESIPLIDSGEFEKSISAESKSWDAATISAVKKSREGKDISEVLFSGATIKVTNKMRGLFYFLSKQNPEIHPLKPTTTTIVIPPRRCMDAATSPMLQKKYEDAWGNAINEAFSGKSA